MVAWLLYLFVLAHSTAPLERCHAFSLYDSPFLFKRAGNAPLLLPRTGITHAASTSGGDSSGVSFINDSNEGDTNSRMTTIPMNLMMMDPLVSQVLQSVSDDDNPQAVLSVLDFGSVRNASMGISVWRTTLLKGRLPTSQDFHSSNHNAIFVWPPEPLFGFLCKAMAELEFPRFVLTHPEMITPVLRSLLRMTTQFARQQQQQTSQRNKDDEEEDDEKDDDDFSNDFDIFLQEDMDDEWMEQDMNDKLEVFEEELVEQLATEIVAHGLTEQWGGVIRGVRSLDQLFGMNHGLLQDDNNNLDNNIEGFGWNDGVWKHSGWQLIPELQQQISSMPELKVLIQSLGRRPTAEQSNAMDKFIPRRLDEQGALGAQYDPTRRSSIRGITLSGSLSEMLPSEAMLLVQRRPIQEEANNISQIIPSPPQSALRRLFLAKMVESKLLSYESSGWQDVPSTTVPKPRYMTRLPSAPGGPILICLDTSWSMTGRREQLSKAVVLACVAVAHKQKREIQVVAFSSARNVIETGPITADARGVRRLLEFLSSSFGGGTDVTGALKHAMTTICTDTKPENHNTGVSNGSRTKASRQVQEIYNKDINSMAAADMLLVTDGEIPDPPVSEEMMEALDRLKQRAGVQVHGLLVGKRESVPLAKLCTQIHDFLIGYDALLPTTTSAATSSASTGISSFRRSRLVERSMLHLGCRRIDSQNHFGFSVVSLRQSIHICKIQAKFSDFDENDDWGGRGRRQERSGPKKKNYDQFDQYDELITDGLEAGEKIETTTIDPLSESSGTFWFRVKEAEASLRASVRESIRNQKWTAASLDEEKQSEDSCWQYRGQLQKAAERIAHGLVERDEEARLVVLGMVAQEHVLFLGPPGTGKSVLGRRLSQLCGGTFFQRLLTRFTTPEEIFGPLSLRALENDEYRRKTDGFLPTATVAFLDEIFKANSAILNTLLTILNERQFDNGAGLREECPIRCVVGASNELPESDELDALYDRFLLRKEVLPVSDEGLMQMLRMPLPGVSPCDGSDTDQDGICNTVFTGDLDKLIRAISAAADTVVMENEAIALLRDLRTFMREDLGVDVSDRRLVKATRLLKVSAACHGRKRVDALDCLLLQHIIWRLPEQKTALKAWLWSRITPGSSGLASVTLQDESLESAAFSSVQQFRVLLDGVRQEAIAAVRKTSGDVTGDSGGKTLDIENLRSLCQEAGHVGTLLQRRSDELERHSELLRRSRDHLWLDPNEALSAQQLLLPRAEAYLKEAHRALEDACTLEKSISPGDHLTNDIRLSVIQLLWDDDAGKGLTFSPEALEMSIKEAKAKYDQETFRSWKRAKKRYEK